jgi:hypothetical protein
MIAQEIQEELQRAIKLSKTNTMTSTEFTVAAADRANKILAFDTNGEISVTQELGTNRGSWSAGVTFNARDIVKDSSNNNVYLCNTTHTSTGSTPISSNADVAKWDLIVDAAAASTSANAAANSASNSSNFANTSANHASNSSNHASNSSNFANNSSNSANTSATYLADVSANANASANSASNASNFANNSSNSANSASNHSSNSSNFANNSSNSANTSANHASNSSNFANNSSNSANASSNHSANSSNFANNSSNHAANSSNFANASSNHASNSSNHSANSSNFANTSSNHAANSSNFSNNSSNFANTASNSANAANSARDAALAAADNFDDVYLGSKTADPTLDNDGDALTAGDLYYNSVGTVLKYYTGSAWVSITSGGITDVVQDTTPQLGGMLDVNGQSIGDGTLELVKFAETASAVNEITVTNSATGNAPEIAATGDDTNIDLRLATKGTGGVVFNAGAVGTPSITTTSDTNTGIFFPAADTIAFTEGGTEAMRINSDGYVGINTTTPTARLDVSESTFATIARITRTNTNQTTANLASLRVKTITSLDMADGMGTSIQFSIQDSANVENDIALLGAVRSGADNSGALTFATSNAGSSAERMRIDSSGNVLIGTTSSEGRITIRGDSCGGYIGSITNSNDSACNPAHGLIFRAGFNGGASGSQFFSFRRPDDNVLGSITQNGASAVAYNTSSDYRLKENVNYNFDATTRLKQLKPARFNFIEDANRTVDGFLAHEVQSIIPEAITGTKDETETKEKVVVNSNGNVIRENIEQADWEAGKIPNEEGTSQYPIDSTWEASKVVPVYQGIDQAKLTPLLTKALQEAIAKIESLEARLTALESK